MTFSTEQGDNLREFLHALRKVIIEIARRSEFTRSELEDTIMPKMLRLIAIEYEASLLAVQSQSESDKSVTKFNEYMKYLSFAITNEEHCKFLLTQNPHSADPNVKAYKALSSLDLIITYCDESASKVSLTLTAAKSKWTPDLKPTTIATGSTGKTVLVSKLINAAYSAGLSWCQ